MVVETACLDLISPAFNFLRRFLIACLVQPLDYLVVACAHADRYEQSPTLMITKFDGATSAQLWRREYSAFGWVFLDGFSEIKVCLGYRLDGREIDYLPASEHAQARVEPIYETVGGWQEPTARARSWAELPAQAIKYVRRIEELVGCSVALLSTSPEREDTILMHNPFEN